MAGDSEANLRSGLERFGAVGEPLAVSALGVVGVDGETAIAFSILMQAIWFIPTTIAGGLIAVREVHRDARRLPVDGEPPVPSPG